METIFSILKYLVGGFFALIIVLMILGLLFGKRIKTRWEFDADFLDDNGREIGEFDIELSRIEKEEKDYSIKADLRLKHADLGPGSKVEVLLDETVVMTGDVKDQGRIRLTTESMLMLDVQAKAGQLCTVVCDNKELCSAELVPD